MIIILIIIFYNCTALSSVDIAGSVMEMGDDVFSGCSSIRAVYCHWQLPIWYDEYFPNSVLQNATLYVPVGTKENYEKVFPWSSFWNIEEVDYDDDATAIGEVSSDGAAAASVSVEGGVIVLGGLRPGTVVEVYSVGGQCLYRGTGARIGGLPAGVYVVKVGNFSAKVVL